MGAAERSLALAERLALDVGYRSRLFCEMPEKAVIPRITRAKKSAKVTFESKNCAK
jgi:hypothetical protein